MGPAHFHCATLLFGSRRCKLSDWLKGCWQNTWKDFVRSGIRTHAHRSGLRPERSALDLSAILTLVFWISMSSCGIRVAQGDATSWDFLDILICYSTIQDNSNGENHLRFEQHIKIMKNNPERLCWFEPPNCGMADSNAGSVKHGPLPHLAP